MPFTLHLPEDLFYGPKERSKIIVHKPIRPGDPEFKDVATLRKHCFDTVMVSDIAISARAVRWGGVRVCALVWQYTTTVPVFLVLVDCFVRAGLWSDTQRKREKNQNSYLYYTPYRPWHLL